MTEITEAYDAASRLMDLLYQLDMVESVNYEAFDGTLEATFRAGDVVKLIDALEIAKARWQLVERVNEDFADDLMAVAVDQNATDEEFRKLLRETDWSVDPPKKRWGLFGRRH